MDLLSPSLSANLKLPWSVEPVGGIVYLDTVYNYTNLETKQYLLVLLIMTWFTIQILEQNNVY